MMSTQESCNHGLSLADNPISFEARYSVVDGKNPGEIEGSCVSVVCTWMWRNGREGNERHVQADNETRDAEIK